jgi:hypothetical protein
MVQAQGSDFAYMPPADFAVVGLWPARVWQASTAADEAVICFVPAPGFFADFCDVGFIVLPAVFPDVLSIGRAEFAAVFSPPAGVSRPPSPPAL